MRGLVLGAGQLGAMMGEVASRLGVELWRYCPDTHRYFFGTEMDSCGDKGPDGFDWVTAERELLPQTPFHGELLNLSTYQLVSDRLPQKKLYDELDLPTAPWGELKKGDSADALLAKIGTSLVVKARQGGYDGKGQWRVKEPGFVSEADCIAEAMIPFQREVSLVGVRAKDGRKLFYPLVENFHKDGILVETKAPAPDMHQWQGEAERILGALMDHLGYVGVMAVELFDCGDKLLINEMAPRVHNSGHWTQDGANICQFELHLRAVAGLPLPAELLWRPTIMDNLIGVAFDPNWLAGEGKVHWYNKEPRPGRKVGHINRWL
ncbi:ATP-grasp domain-containing protein [Gallaecimonas kandeliae]|uniref:ATP-grasp domain-containing protein n=1 Tax=Gallaecimonas kandeliae TaxID=3029055 RepID=UPI00264A085D|nr:ATP-grasp domain-containing protein [Gallaecimonas kandeliae]WKE66114.1 ATP-grasp domain-containing protein [Gallaecimonas kandeliae]